LTGRTVAVMAFPTRPVSRSSCRGSGAPGHAAIVDYLVSSQEFDTRFPGFENEVHGVDVVAEDGPRAYYIYCVAE